MLCRRMSKLACRGCSWIADQSSTSCLIRIWRLKQAPRPAYRWPTRWEPCRDLAQIWLKELEEREHHENYEEQSILADRAGRDAWTYVIAGDGRPEQRELCHFHGPAHDRHRGQCQRHECRAQSLGGAG